MPDPDFSRTIKADDIGLAEKNFSFEASAEERQALAGRFDLLDLASLKAHVTYRRLSKRKVNCRGSFTAEVIQACVVSLAPVSTQLEGSFERIFEDGLQEVRQKEVEVHLDDNRDEDIVAIIGGLIDPGEAITEELGLAIPEFPRSEGAAFSEFSVGPDDGDPAPGSGRPNPFAALQELKDKMT